MPGGKTVGFLYPGRPDPEFESWRSAFVASLREHAWVEGDNLSITWRFAGYDEATYGPLARELAQASCDLLATAGTPLTGALRAAAPLTPIVTGVGDPVGSGFARTLQEPGGFITGLTWALREKARTQISLLREMVPGVRLLLVPRSRRYGHVGELNACLQGAAGEFGLELDIHSAATEDELEASLAELPRDLSCALMIYGEGAFQFDPRRIAAMAITRRMASVCDPRNLVDSGFLFSYLLRHHELERSFASIVDRILRGESPRSIPFQMPTRSEFVINATAAQSLGIRIPPELRDRADDVVQ